MVDSKMKGRKFAAVVLLTTAALACLVAALVWFQRGYRSAQELKQEKAADVAAGMPMELADLHLGHIPNEDNAAEIYRKVAAYLSADFAAP